MKSASLLKSCQGLKLGEIFSPPRGGKNRFWNKGGVYRMMSVQYVEAKSLEKPLLGSVGFGEKAPKEFDKEEKKVGEITKQSKGENP